jgi:hypothetical protein
VGGGLWTINGWLIIYPLLIEINKRKKTIGHVVKHF